MPSNTHSWLESLKTMNQRSGESVCLPGDFRSITQHGLTDGFSASVRFNARYEVMSCRDERHDVIDKGLATVSVMQSRPCQWHGQAAREVPIHIEWFAGHAGFVDDLEESARLYLSGDASQILACHWRGEVLEFSTLKNLPRQWPLDLPHPIGDVKWISPDHGDEAADSFIAIAETFDADRLAFRVKAVPKGLDGFSRWTSAWVTESDGTPFANFISFCVEAQGEDVLILLMIEFQ